MLCNLADSCKCLCLYSCKLNSRQRLAIVKTAEHLTNFIVSYAIKVNHVEGIILDSVLNVLGKFRKLLPVDVKNFSSSCALSINLSCNLVFDFGNVFQRKLIIEKTLNSCRSLLSVK